MLQQKRCQTMQNKAAAYLNSFIILANGNGFLSVNGMRKILPLN